MYSNKFIRKARPKTHKVRLHLLLNKIFHTTVLLFPLNFFLIHASLKFSFECFRGYYKSSMGGVRVREETDEQLKLVKEPSLQSFGIVIGLYSSKMAFFSLKSDYLYLSSNRYKECVLLNLKIYFIAAFMACGYGAAVYSEGI